MAYIAVETVATGQAGWGATWVNTFIKNNFAAGVPDIFTTKGDLAVGTAADTATRLAVGAVNGYILFSDSSQTTGLRWGFPGLAKVNDNGSQTIGAIPEKLTQLDNEFYDLYSVWAGDRFTSAMAGYYLVTCMFQFDVSAGTWTANNKCLFMTYKNGAIYSHVVMGIAQASGSNYVISGSAIDVIYLDYGAYLEFYAVAESGSAPDVNPNADDTSHHISITYLPS